MIAYLADKQNLPQPKVVAAETGVSLSLVQRMYREKGLSNKQGPVPRFSKEELVALVEEHGSPMKAAKATGMSYVTLWRAYKQAKKNPPVEQTEGVVG